MIYSFTFLILLHTHTHTCLHLSYLFVRFSVDDLGDGAQHLAFGERDGLLTQKGHGDHLIAAGSEMATQRRQQDLILVRPPEPEAVHLRVVGHRERQHLRLVEVAVAEIHQIGFGSCK